MRNLKKILSVLVVIAMIAVTMVPAFAATSYTYDAQAKALYDVGLFKGVSATEYAPDLGASLTREQGIAIIVRLLGKADEAAKLTAADADAALAAYTDAKDIDASLKNIVAYAVKNKLVLGASDTTLEPKAAMTGNQLSTILLRNLGYTVDAAGSETAAATLADKGATLDSATVAKFATKSLIRDDLVGIAYAALQAKDKDGKKIIDQLIANKVVDQAAAEKAGLVTKVTAATSMTAKVSGRDSIAVTFNGAVDTTKVTFAVKKTSGTISVTPKFADDKKSATLVGTSKFTEGDYTVTATGVTDKDLTATVSFEEEKVAKIEFTSDKAVIVPTKVDADENKSAYVYFKLENQYGEDITESYNTYSGDLKWSSTYKDIDEANAKYGKLVITVDPGDEDLRYGDSLPISAVYTNDQNVVTASTVLTVASKAGVGSIEITKLYNDLGKKVNVNSTFSSFYLLFDLKDQYGNALVYDTDEDLIKDDLSVTSSNPSVLKFLDDENGYYDFQKVVIDGKDYIGLPLNAESDNRSGSAVVTVVSQTTGKMAQYTVDVAEGKYAASFTLQKPDVAVIGEKTIIPFSAYDADGNEVTDVDDLVCSNEDYKVDLDVSGLGVSSSDEGNYLYFEKNPSSGKAQLVLKTAGLDLEKDDTVTITSITGKTFKTSSITLKLKEAKQPDSISGIASSYYKKIAEGAFAEFAYDKLTIKDQYSRDYAAKEVKYQLINDLGVQPTTTYKIDTTTGNTVVDKYAGTTLLNEGNYRIGVKSSSDNLKVSGAYVDTAATSTTGYTYFIGKGQDKVYFYGAKEGTSTVTVQMQQKVAGVWTNMDDVKTSFTMTTVALDDIKDFAVGTIGKTFDAPYYDNTNTKLIATTGYDNSLGVDGLTADGSKVWLSRQLLTDEAAGKVENAYTLTPSYDDKIIVKTDSSVAGIAYAVQFKDKFHIGTAASVNTLTPAAAVTGNDGSDDGDEVTVPYAVSINTALFDNAKTKTYTQSFVVSDDLPEIATLALAYNNVAQLSSDGASIMISEKDLNTLKTNYSSDLTTIINKIVADAVVAKDQYGKEHSNEYINGNGAFYNILIPADAQLDSKHDIDVTVISRSGAVTLTFNISVK